MTIDKEIQKFATELLADKAASICVMDIFNGDIVTMASSPNYDPNAFVHGIDKDYWKQLIGNDLKPLNNKAISGLYPPGSTIKTIVALSALENDVWNPKKTPRELRKRIPFQRNQPWLQNLKGSNRQRE